MSDLVNWLFRVLFLLFISLGFLLFFRLFLSWRSLARTSHQLFSQFTDFHETSYGRHVIGENADLLLHHVISHRKQYQHGNNTPPLSLLAVMYFHWYIIHIVTDSINALPGNSYVNTVQHATIDEAVFSMSSASSNSRNRVLCDQLLGHATVLIIRLWLLCGPCPGSITRFPE
jgi:hypothetical protein